MTCRERSVEIWIEEDQILPLLDGLDEVRQEHRAACGEAINTFRCEYSLINIAICSRIVDYEALGTRLKLHGAILLQPLTPQQINAYLTSAGDQLVGLRMALESDAALRDLAASPLMLSIMILAYRGLPSGALETGVSLDAQRTRLFATYVDQMFRRRSVDTRYPEQQTIAWLAWLARRMTQHNQSIFLIERLQPTWLQSSRQQRLYAFGVGLTTGLVFGLIAVLGDWLAFAVAWGLIWG